MHYTNLILNMLQVSEQPVPLDVIQMVFEALTTNKLPGSYLQQLESKGEIVLEAPGDGTKLVSLPKPIDLEEYERRTDVIQAVRVTDTVLRKGVNLLGTTRMDGYIDSGKDGPAYKGDWIVVEKGEVTVYNPDDFYKQFRKARWLSKP